MKLVTTLATLWCLLVTNGEVPAGDGPRPLVREVNDSAFVVYGTLSNAKLDAEGGVGSTELSLDLVIKDHEVLKGKQRIVLPRYVPVDGKSHNKLVVFCDVHKGKIDPYRGVPCKDRSLADYLVKALALPKNDPAARLSFFFDHLDHASSEVSSDAYIEFVYAEMRDSMAMVTNADKAKTKSKLVGWLRDPNTPVERHWLYGYSLAMSGESEDANCVLDLLTDPKRGIATRSDGLLAAYASLKPSEGWAYLFDRLSDPTRDFYVRIAALRAIRFLWDFQSDRVPRKDLLTGYEVLLDQADIADFSVDDLRARQQWQLTDRILGLATKSTHQTPILRRSIIRFALSAPGGKALAFVNEQRKSDPKRVKDEEELLEIEKLFKK